MLGAARAEEGAQLFCPGPPCAGRAAESLGKPVTSVTILSPGMRDGEELCPACPAQDCRERPASARKRLISAVLQAVRWASGGDGPVLSAGGLDTELLTGTIHRVGWELQMPSCSELAGIQTWADWLWAGVGRAGRRLPCVCLSPRTPS